MAESAGKRRKKKLVTIETLEHIPDDYDPRLTSILRDAVPDDVLVSFYNMAISETPHGNYRWELHRDGRLFVAYHSGEKKGIEKAFDRPLPKRPTREIGRAHV